MMEMCCSVLRGEIIKNVISDCCIILDVDSVPIANKIVS